MKIFISWSGERSRQIAQCINEWLACVIQAAKPWISTRDIDRGALWFSTITQELGDTSLGIICLTKENIDKPWILFEAGALAKGLSSSRVCTLLIDLEPKDIRDPLAQFNHTFPTKESMYGLALTLNNAGGQPHLSEAVLQRSFDTYWPQFEDDFKRIIDQTKEAALKKPDENEILFEILEGQRAISKRMARLERDSSTRAFMARENLNHSPAPAASTPVFDIDTKAIRQYMERLNSAALGRTAADSDTINDDENNR